MQGELTRRDLLRAGLVLGTGAILAGCRNKQAGWKPLSESELNGPPRKKLAGPVRPRPDRLPSAPGGVLSRREWTSAGVIYSLANPMNGVSRITVHHSAIPAGHIRSKAESVRMLENIRRNHLAQQWADIGYHYIIDPSGRIWEGRPVQYQGAHVKLNNEHNLGVMLLGNFEEERPTSAALAALDTFVSDRMRTYRIPITRIYTHQEIMATACPGRNLQGYMVATRSGSGRMARA
jgi:hypothetical protein